MNILVLLLAFFLCCALFSLVMSRVGLKHLLI